MPHHVLISIIGHLASAPRAQKEAEALAKAGYKVTICGRWWNDDLAIEDIYLAEKIGVHFLTLVDLRGGIKGALTIRLKRRLALELYAKFRWVTPRSFGYCGPEIVAMATRLHPDLVIVHSEEGLWAGKELLKAGFRIGVDFEDWFSEDLLPEARNGRPVAAIKDLELYHLRHASFCMATTQAMAEAMAKESNVERIPVAIPNSFPWSARQSAAMKQRDLRGDEVSFYWYSQTIGAGRGLEELGQALTNVRGNWKLRLRGTLRASAGWFENSFPEAIRDKIELISPVANTELLARHMSHDVGLALEVPFCGSRNLTATNKIFDYLRAGLAVIATDTAGQCEVMRDCMDAGWLVPSGRTDVLAWSLQEAVDDPSGLLKRKHAALEAAQHRWAWELFEPELVRVIQSAMNHRV